MRIVQPRPHHPDRFENVVADEVHVVPARRLFDDDAQQRVPEGAVGHFRTWSMHERVILEDGERITQRGVVLRIVLAAVVFLGGVVSDPALV